MRLTWNLIGLGVRDRVRDDGPCLEPLVLEVKATILGDAWPNRVRVRVRVRVKVRVEVRVKVKVKVS